MTALVNYLIPRTNGTLHLESNTVKSLMYRLDSK